MVPVATASARVTPCGLDRVTVKVSLASTALSPITSTWMVLVVSPGAKVMVPLPAT